MDHFRVLAFFYCWRMYINILAMSGAALILVNEFVRKNQERSSLAYNGHIRDIARGDVIDRIIRNNDNLNYIVMESESNDGVTPGKVRHWTTVEEQLLIAILQDLVVEGYKYPNGKFKPGTHELAAEKMRQKMEGANITFKHVANKMKRWSTKYYAVYDMMSTSGFGWDDTNKCVIVDSPQVLQQYLAHHPRGQNFVNKPYPEFEKMQFIFGKDRADGHLAEGTADAVGNMQHDTEMDNEFNEDENEVPLNSPASGTTQREPGLTSRTSKKRARENDRLIACVEAFVASVNTSNNNITMVAQSIAPPQREHDLVVEELKKMNITRFERIEATVRIAKCPTLTGLFLKMDGHDKVEFVNTVLRVEI